MSLRKAFQVDIEAHIAWLKYKDWCNAQAIPKKARLTEREHFRAYLNNGDSTDANTVIHNS